MIRAHDLGVKGEKNILNELKGYSLDGIQLVSYKCTEDIKYEAGAITPRRATEIGETLANGGCEVALIGAYFNPVHPDCDKIDRGIAVFKDYISVCTELGCSAVGSETGSYNGDPWIYHPKNHSEEALCRVVSCFGELCDYAADFNVSVAIEGAFGHVCHTPERLYEAIRRIGKSNIKVILDLYNYLDISNYKDAYEILERGLRLFSDKILLFHIKDFTVGENKLIQCGVGRGILDYDRILSMIYSHNKDAILVLEGTVGEDISYAVSFLRNKIDKLTK